MPRCSMCNASIMWARTPPKADGKKGSSMPLELPPDPAGNAWIESGFVVVASAERRPPPNTRRYKPHFISCVPYLAQKRVEKALRDAAKAKRDADTDAAMEAAEADG